MHVLVIVNPGASRAEAATRELSQWFSEHATSTFVCTDSVEDLKQALAAHGASADRIVIGGGDGTISSALPELLRLDKPLTVLPLGTANDFARTLGVPPDAMKAAEVALSGREHRIDIGSVNGRPFLNVASVGLAAKVTEAQSTKLKRRWHVLSYLISLWRAVWEARPFYLEVELDGAPAWSGAVYQVSVGNGRFHGGGLTVAEHAAIDDGTFDLYLVRPGAVWQLLACATHLRFGFAKPRPVEAWHRDARELAHGDAHTDQCRRGARCRHAGDIRASPRGTDRDRATRADSRSPRAFETAMIKQA